jgi:hypothetical protein
VIPTVGCGIAGLAFLVGRSLLPRRGESDAKVLQAGSTAVAGVASNRRSAPRRAGNMVEVALWDGSDGPQMRAVVGDRSVGGLRLFLDEPIKTGKVLKVRPRSAPITTPWTDIIIRSCRLVDGQWEAGCQFQQTPSYSVLLLFG